MGVEFVRAETVGFETEEQIVSHKVGVTDGNPYQKLKRIHVCCKHTGFDQMKKTLD